MTEKQVVIDLNDPRSTKIAEALANPTAKKILNLLAESELSATEIANKLKIPLNTATYNLDNLTKSGLIEPTNKFLWSVKGKKINSYRLSNKKIVISPKSFSMKGIVPAILGTVLISALVKYFTSSNVISQSSNLASQVETGVASAPSMAADIATSGAEKVSGLIAERAPEIIQNCISSSQPVWAWFFLGSMVAILVLLLWNLLSNMKGGQ